MVSATTRYKGKLHRYYACRSCNTEAQRKKALRQEVRQQQLVRTTRYRKENPEKEAAWRAAAMIETDKCMLCDDVKYLHRHHPDYSQPTKVVVLCAAHHKMVHAGRVSLLHYA